MKAKIVLGASLDEVATSDEVTTSNEVTTSKEVRATELHKEYRKPKHFLKVQIFDKDNTHASDIIVMSNISSEGFKYILVVIDLYTRYG